ncbi:phosphatidylinositol 4,5-bisphosphate effector protein, putative [Candida dubliniensis CD36]|uniref:Phosphatidylinositol 4,5-bisphosphate effector protein, putative n=1 Tax=Candida dubliniensis (strain CD36 / ATCC MYA-646 / CBS 7987 / NCPF 3949 / NRRL Y-17841) TaxID=573826 RepID=B9WIS0_CANDC|nr:phosphatidylinositol 4,5-bisphosphate effector protein, putative [Candida dubliniensis CD36]CAX41138.1 phosphatidylinositol 4,5-bisphosphate effector protein, putative [Candida dubliniensis CD36]
MPSHNPLVITLPYTFSNQDVPTEIMANRFSAWRSIIKDLVNYFKEYSSVQEEIIRQQSRLQQAVGQITNTTTNNNNYNNSTPNSEIEAINNFFLPIGNGSVQDIPNALFKFHQKNVVDGSKTLKDINGLIIPKLEELRKDLLVKIKEIKNLQNDFKNNLSKELNDTKSLISQYNQAIELANKLGSTGNFSHITTLHEADSGKSDPYLVKIRLERQLKRQLVEENYLYDAYANLQNAGRQLESIVVLEIQNYVSMFLNLVNEENLNFSQHLLPNISNGFLSKESNFEWDAFIERNLPNVNNHGTVSSGTFIDLNIPKRHLSDFVIKNFDSNLNVAIREGYLERRSKFLKNYTSAWYVLTCSYIHEFKSSDRKKDPQPVMSLPLDSCTVSDHSKNDGKLEGVYKFILTSKSHNTLMNKTHKWVFRTNTYQNMIEWFDSIKKMTSLPTPAARARTIEGGNSNGNNGTSGKTIASDTTSGNSISRVSSGNTARSPARSLKTVSTNTTSASQAYKHRSLNQASSSHKRLSSTFSQRNNNQSPRLTNMINSDGTIITPVDTDEDSMKRSSRIYQQQKSQQQQQQPQQPQQQGPSTPNQQPGPYHLIPIANQQHQQQQQQFVNPPAGYQYYIPSNAQQGAQQFYDPVQQQYYTITPTVPVNSNSNNNNQQQQQQQQQQPAPQPQYFSTSPLPTPQIIPGSPVAPAFGQYFQQPQFVQQKQQQKDGGLPYPTMSRTTSIYNNDDTITDEQIPKPTAQQQRQDQGKDQLGSSLYTGHPNGDRPGQGISQLSNEEVSTLNSNNESNPRTTVQNKEHVGDISIEVTPGKD